MASHCDVSCLPTQASKIGCQRARPTGAIELTVVVCTHKTQADNPRIQNEMSNILPIGYLIEFCMNFAEWYSILVDDTSD